MGRRVSKKIGAGRGRGRALKDDDDYDPGMAKKRGPKAKPAASAPKVQETKTAERFAEKFTAAKPKPVASKKAASDSDDFSDNDFAALRGKPSKATKPEPLGTSDSEVIV